MERIDLEYLCRVIGNLAGIPIRIYMQNVITYFYSVIEFPVDPIKPYADKIFEIEEHVGYFTTPYFNYYGVVRSGDLTVVIGPSRQTPMSDRDMRELAFSCEVESSKTDDFIASMKGLIQMPLGSIVQILCTMNYVLNGEKLSLEDVTIYDFEQTNLENILQNERFNKQYDNTDEYKPRELHNTLALEETLMQMISKGDVGALYEWLSHAPSVRGGIIANDALRQLKNTFIVTATLASRAAIKGGLNAEDSLSLSDEYIRKCELMSSVDQIVNLQYHMVLDYTRRVERVRLGKKPSKLLMQVTNYIQHNLSRPVDVDDLSKTLFISRTHLASKFKQETGMTFRDYIQKLRIEKCCELLAGSDILISDIARMVGYDDIQFFHSVFKKYLHMTPREYRRLKG